MSAPESSMELPAITPEERLERIQDFLFTTLSLNTQHFYFNRLSAPLMGESDLTQTREDMMVATNDNMILANTALDHLRLDTRRNIQVQHPETGEFGTLGGVLFNPDKCTFLGNVVLRNRPGKWDIGAFPTLSLQ